MATITRRSRSDGTTRYQATIRRKGLPSAISRTFLRQRDAKAWARSTEIDLERGVLATGSLIYTVSDLFDRYSVDNLQRLRSGKGRLHQLEWWRARIGDLKLGELGAADIQQGLRELQNHELSNATINRYRAAINAALEYARRELKWIRENPAALTSKFTEPRGRTRFLSDDERGRLLEACASHADLRLMVLIALTTGARQGEILSLKWSNIDLRERTVYVPTSKNGEPRVLPLSETVVKELRNRVTAIGQGDWLFPSTVHPMKSALFPSSLWKRVRAAAELPDFRFHDLRHTAASYLAQNGVSTRQLADMLGHKTLAMVQRYSHLTVTSRRPLVDYLDSKLEL